MRSYVETLGFRQTGSDKEDGGSEIWAEVALGESRIWFFSNALEERPEPVFSGLVCVFVDDVDAIARQLKGHVPFQWGPQT